MTKNEMVVMLRRSVAEWNEWRRERPADLSEADLREADLRRADLSEADLSRADLSEANLRRAKR